MITTPAPSHGRARTGPRAAAKYRGLAVGMTLVATAGLTGCGGNGAAPWAAPSSVASAASPAATPQAEPDTTEPDTTEPDTTTPGTAAPVTPGCKAADLTLALVEGDGGAGMSQNRLDLQFTNKSRNPCTLWGSPGVSFVTGDNGQQVGDPAQREDRSKGRPVTVAPGQNVKSPLRIVHAEAYPPEQCRPVQARGLRVYAPGDTAAMFIQSPQQACSAPGKSTLSVGVVQA